MGSGQTGKKEGNILLRDSIVCKHINIRYIVLTLTQQQKRNSLESIHDIYLSCGLNTGSILEEELNHLDPVLLARDVKRREAVECPGVGVGLAVQKQLGHTDMATVGGHVQGSQVVHSHLVHRGFVVQQDSEI